jgi:acyl-CoA reductase-like NAD-dependent aldehyde dehydrogenase
MFDPKTLSQLLIGGEWVAGASQETLYDRYTAQPFASMGVASDAQVDAAVAGTLKGFHEHRLSPMRRYEILMAAAEKVHAWREQIIELMTCETGFTRLDGENEVRRCMQTLRLSGEEAKRICGDMVPMEAAPGVERRLGYTVLVPKGVVCAITPFNSPLNVVAHKIAPALAAGNAVVLKPSEFTPLTASLLCRALIEAGLPPALLAMVHGDGARVGQRLLDNPDIAFYTFTGSTRVGKAIQSAAGLRGTQLELGSIASTIVCHDADLDLAMGKFGNACFRKAGQVCTSVQRILVDARIYGEFKTRLVASVKALAVGDPRQADTVVGPMITQAHAERAVSWVQQAREAGAVVLTGGERDGAVMQPTVLEGVTPEMRVVNEEIFAPCVSLIPFDSLDDALNQANATPFGLAVGIFTRDISTALNSVARLRFGGIHINETSSSRVDQMPFGGVKDSGFGREGPRYAIRELLEERLVTIAY